MLHIIICCPGNMPENHSSPFISLSTFTPSPNLTTLSPQHLAKYLYHYTEAVLFQAATVFLCVLMWLSPIRSPGLQSYISLFHPQYMCYTQSSLFGPCFFYPIYACHSPNKAFVLDMLNYLVLFCISGFQILVT